MSEREIKGPDTVNCNKHLYSGRSLITWACLKDPRSKDLKII